MGKDFWAIIGVGAVLLSVVVASWVSSSGDTRKVEANLRDDINRVEDRLGDDINRVEDRLGDDINRVHGDIRILLEHALRGQADGSGSAENAQD